MSCRENESFLGIELNAPQENTTDFASFRDDEKSDFGRDENSVDGRDAKDEIDEDGFETLNLGNK